MGDWSMLTRIDDWYWTQVTIIFFLRQLVIFPATLLNWLQIGDATIMSKVRRVAVMPEAVPLPILRIKSSARTENWPSLCRKKAQLGHGEQIVQKP
ncbi:unnamed protein product [Musa banksii]